MHRQRSAPAHTHTRTSLQWLASKTNHQNRTNPCEPNLRREDSDLHTVMPQTLQVKTKLTLIPPELLKADFW